MSKILLKRILQKISITLLWCFFLQLNASAGNGNNVNTLPSSSYADEVIGRVTELSGKPLLDVTVQIKGRPISSVLTDADGKFMLMADKGDVLIFKVNGFKTQEIAFTGQKQINVSLAEDHSPSDSFNLLYTKQKKTTNLESVSEIRTEDLTKTISSPIYGTLTGRLTGLSTYQSAGEPGNDGLNLTLRGLAPLVILDGIPQTFTSINPEQVESVTVLKDALATAMMGIRASNGLVLITTKKGAEGPQRIGFKAMYGFSRPTELPKTLDAYNYALLYNEALTNDGRPAAYTPTDLEAYKNGNNPFYHPNVNWQNEILRKETPYSRYNVDISGGKQTAKYYVSLDYLDQQGLFKESDLSKNSTNSGYKRYVFRSNVSLDLSKYITTSLNLFGRLQSGNEPGVSTNTLYNNIINTPANAYPIFNANGSLGASQDFQQNNIYGQNFMSGYQVGYTRDFRVDLAVKADLQKLTPGLWFRALSAINTYLDQTTVRSKALVAFLQSVDGTGNTVYTQYGTLADQINSLQTNTQNRVFYLQGELGYAKKVGSHNFDALLIANNDYRMGGVDLAYNIRGISGKLAYNYQEKYLAQVAFAYNGTSERYAKGNGYGLFPAIGLGWNIKKENFLANNAKWLNDLKLRTTFGRTGNFNPNNYYTYNQYYTSGTGYNFGTNTGGTVTGIEQGALANPSLTFEKANKFNVGIDALMVNSKLSLTAEYFNNKYFDLLQLICNNTQITGATYTERNLGERNYSGFEFELNYNNKIGDFNYFISPNFSTVRTRLVFADEPTRQFAYQTRTGLPVSQSFGYVASGLFQTQAEINASPKPANLNIVPGDIRYIDQNGDNVIDENDQVAIGRTGPALNFGLNLGGSYKGFDFSALLQGRSNYDIYLGGNYYWAFQGNRGQAYEHNLDRWTPATAATASYPRVSVGNNVNNQLGSTYWLRNADFLRLKSVELGYTFPIAWVKKIKASGARLFVNGTNLFTITGLEDRDPEGYFNTYPIQKMLVAGISVKF
jgi:TonB-linked SusC/RagA family outer membrane protein